MQRFDVFAGYVFNHVWNFEAAKRSFSFWLICFAFLACWLQFANKGNKSRKNVGMYVRQMEMSNVPIPPSTPSTGRQQGQQTQGFVAGSQGVEVCLGLAFEMVSMVPLAMVSDKVLVSLDPQ